MLRLEESQLREMVAARRVLPLARLASEEEAALVAERLAGFGLRVEIVPDEALALETQAVVRVRRLEFGADSLTGWSGDEAHVFAWEEISLLAAGRLFTKQIETEERRSRLGMEKEITDAREMTEDEGVLDLFDGRGANWRLTSAGFDYSCLGPRKTLLARENFVTLAETLRERASRAAFDDDYLRVRHLLASAWPLAERTESRGLRRARPGKLNVETATVLNNEEQWTRYARLRWFYEKRKAEK